ncbi:conserved hypothetical protein [Streptomyces sp. SPB78]|nr:conserved hypothetical protein [Streptomyces sp. SPB78]
MPVPNRDEWCDTAQGNMLHRNAWAAAGRRVRNSEFCVRSVEREM